MPIAQCATLLLFHEVIRNFLTVCTLTVPFPGLYKGGGPHWWSL